MTTVTSPDEKNAYVIEQAYAVNVGGGEVLQATDTIVQERLSGQEPPQFASCVSTASTPDCTQISNPGAVFEAASGVMAPDGHSLYVASRAGVARFAIEPSGGLRYAECFRSQLGLVSEECFAPTGSAGSEETEQVAIAPDEKDLYVTAEARMIDIHLGPGGSMSLGHCYRFRSICPWGGAEAEKEGMAAVTPNGQMVVNVMSDNQVNAYKREPTGSLRFTGCITGLVHETGLPGDECPTPAGGASALQILESIAVAPNSRDIYVTGGVRTGRAGGSAPITLLHLTPAGSLEFAGCWGVEVAGCTNLPLPATWWSNPYQVGKRIAVSPDGTHLVLATDTGIDLLRVDPASGALSWEGCAGRDGGCETLQGEPIGGQGGGLEFTPSGREVWMDDAGSAVRMRLGATAPAEAPPPISGSGRARVAEYTVNLCAPPSARGPNARFYYEIEGPSRQLFYTPASPEPCEGHEGISANTRLQLGDSYRYRLVSRTPEATAHGPWGSFKTEACPHPGNEGRGARPDIASTSLTWSGANGYGCAPHKVVLEYGETLSYGHTVPATSESGMRLLWKEGGFRVSVGGLRPQTTYYWRLSVENNNRMEPVGEGASTTPAPVSGAVEMFAETGTATVQGAGALSLTGYAWSGDTPVSVAAQVFNEAREGAEPIQVIRLGQLPASRERTVVTTGVSGLECGRAYNWRLLTEASYGKSLGAREPFTIPCPAGPEVVKSPSSESVTEGQPASFEATGTGQPAPSVQWEVSRNGGAAWEAVTGATADTLLLPVTTASQSGYEYRAVFTNDAGKSATAAAVLTVRPKSSETTPGGRETSGGTKETEALNQGAASAGSAGNPFAPGLRGVLGQQTVGEPLASLLSTHVRASRHGVLRIVLRCPANSGLCTGRLFVRRARSVRARARGLPTLLAAARFKLEPGVVQPLGVHLAPAALGLLKRRHLMSVRVTIATEGGRETTYVLSLLAPSN